MLDHEVLEDLSSKLKKRQAILFTDFDGTLLPIHKDPKGVHLSEDVRIVLEALSRKLPVNIISGRSLNDLKSRTGIPGINLCGNHGLEIEGPVGCFLHPDAILSFHTMQKISSSLKEAFSNNPTVAVENKGLSLSVHCKFLNAEHADRFFKNLSDYLKPFFKYGDVVMTHGKNVFEIRPNVKWGKENAMRWILDRYRQINPREEYFPIYAGDDLTDIPALSLASDCGFSIWVGDPNPEVRTSAYVSSSREWVDFLLWLTLFLRVYHVR